MSCRSAARPDALARSDAIRSPTARKKEAPCATSAESASCIATA